MTGNNGRITPEDRAKPVRRVVVALDSTSESLTILETAAWLASAIDSQLAGLFVEDRDLLRLANLPFSQEVSILQATARKLEPERLRQEIRARARMARHAVEKQAERHSIRWTFDIVHGRTEAEVTATAQQNDLIAVTAWTGAARSLRVSGTPAELLRRKTGTAILVASQRIMVRPGPVTVVLRSSNRAEDSLRFAVQIAQSKRASLEILVGAEEKEILAKLNQIIGPLVAGKSPIATRSTLGGTGHRLRERLRVLDRGCVVMTSDVTGRDEKAFGDLLNLMRCPAIILRHNDVPTANEPPKR